MYTILCAFDDRQEALRAMRKTVLAGLPRDAIHLQADLDLLVDTSEESEAPPGASMLARVAAFFSALTRPVPGAPGTYRDAVRRGSTVVIIHVPGAERALELTALMSGYGAFDVEQRSG